MCVFVMIMSLVTGLFKWAEVTVKERLLSLDESFSIRQISDVVDTVMVRGLTVILIECNLTCFWGASTHSTFS